MAPALSVIALVSGGKDSFYSILHCLANGHQVVALANLFPSDPSGTGPAEDLLLQHGASAPLDPSQSDNSEETDLNSFMYQTVGYQIVSLYAEATGIPLYRQRILGTAVDQGLNYQNPQLGAGEVLASSTTIRLGPQAGTKADALGAGERESSPIEDETESLVPLLRTVLQAHPEANALCTGAILSTYQRTRVESVALRLGLIPLSYLWQFTELPASLPGSSWQDPSAFVIAKAKLGIQNVRRQKRGRPRRDDARLLRDMATAGLEPRIIKVASAGLDEDFLWENVASETSIQRVEHAMRRFGAAGGRGSVLGEGGEFETLVVDGPSSLFKGRIIVSEADKRIVREGGGCSWLSFRGAKVEMKVASQDTDEARRSECGARIPDLLDSRFEDILRCLLDETSKETSSLGFVNPHLCRRADSEISALSTFRSSASQIMPLSGLPTQRQIPPRSSSQEWCFLGRCGAVSSDVEGQTVDIVKQIQRRLDENTLPTTAITNSVIVLRHMSDFPFVNKHYGSLFQEPNPPARVTISCGVEFLPEDAAISVYLTVDPQLQPHERRGLHVQSRSYWAPANIGPYSQAIAFPLLPRPSPGTQGDVDDDDKRQDDFYEKGSPFAVSIAGQIPLIPATMDLPASSVPNGKSPDELQITLALQHLWRVAIEMRVGWWTSAVAFFPMTQSKKTMRHRALLAATAWKLAHLWPNSDTEGENSNDDDDGNNDDDDTGPDLWDRKYNPQYMTIGGEEEEVFPLPLPDWIVLKEVSIDDEDTTPDVTTQMENLPPVFAAEVEELPRQAGVEWHAHLGLTEVQPASVTLRYDTDTKISTSDAPAHDLNIYYTMVKSAHGVFIQTMASLKYPENHDLGQRSSISMEILSEVLKTASSRLAELLPLSPSALDMKPKITYVDSLKVSGDDFFKTTGPLVPCRSLWDSQGQRLSAVCVFETRSTRVTISRG
ncbi:adenine nucleotide alpha hydrolases-like protein [Xylariaceae sp. FL0255]|nr:adenine nucleotide alpha hydrolases-like protein [Xylariaceae sp. FL0255]